MDITKRTGVLTLSGVGGAVATVEILIAAHSKIITIDPDYLTPRIILETSNIELTTPTTITLTDPVITGRFILMSSNKIVHNELGYMVYYDSKYKDIIVIPTLELYKTMNYINGSILTISGYGVNFTGVSGVGSVPTPNTGYDIKTTLANLANRILTTGRGTYYETMITPTVNYSSTSVSPVTFINFGLPLSMFPVLDFIAEVNIFSYDSLFDYVPKCLGNQKLTNTGILVAELPV